MKYIALVLALWLALSVCSLAAELKGVEAFPLDQLKPGQKAVGHTVIRGIKVETFDVEILELVPDGGFDGGPMVLARFSGPVVEHSKGIAAGYSGSPVYIGSKLLGAVSMAIPYTDTHIGGITPIGQMLAAMPTGAEPDYTNNTVLPKTEHSGTPIDEEGNPIDERGEKIAYTSDAAAALRFNESMRAEGIKRYAAVPCTTPILYSGISPQIMARYQPQLQKLLGPNFSFAPAPAGAGGDTGLLQLQQEMQAAGGGAAPGLLFAPKTPGPALKGGDAVAVSLMQGDIELNAIGTVTYSDADGRVLIFGHPMLGSGSTNLPMGKGYVVWTFTSIERAFKQGVRLDTLGTLTQDRLAACGGKLNTQPDLIPFKIKIKDIDNGSERVMNVSVIRHPDYTPMLMAMALSQAAGKVLDRQSGGTMKMSYHIEGIGLKEPLRRVNYYSDDMDVISQGAYELAPIANLLTTNIYRDVKLSKVEVLLEITRNRVNASIDDAELVIDKATPAPGMPQTPDMHQVLPEQTPPSQPAQPAQPGSGMVLPGGKLPLNQISSQLPAIYGGVPLQQQDPDQPNPNPNPNPNQQQSTTPPPIMGPGGMMPGGNIPTFAPGETIKVRVRLQPFRTDAIFREFSIKVPDDFPSGSTMILVHGGGDLISMSDINGKGRNLFGMGPIIEVKDHDLDSILDQIIEWPLNNELLVTLARPFDPAAPQELGAQDDNKEKPDDKIDAKYQMEYVIYNGFMLPVNIQTKEDQALAAQMTGTIPADTGAPTTPAGDSAPQSGQPDATGEGDYIRTSASLHDGLRQPLERLRAGKGRQF
ncbi:hypothetical protein IT575_10990 [bacterium]|nr:hypothetical protein [bacterium]